MPIGGTLIDIKSVVTAGGSMKQDYIDLNVICHPWLLIYANSCWGYVKRVSKNS